MKCLTPNEGKTVVNGAEHKYRYPCGKCDNCRRVRQQQVKLRLLLESIEHEHCSFLTFTYNNLHVPINPTYEDIRNDAQRLIKRLRKLWYRKTGRYIRYYLVHELGTLSNRSHYHAIIYGIPASEQSIFENAWRKNIGTSFKPKYVTLGFIHARELTPARIGYCVKYSTKLLTSNSDGTDNGAKEFALMSRGSKKRGTKGLGLNNISKIAASIESARRASQSTLSKSQYFEENVGSIKIGKSRMSLDPYLKQKIFEYLRTQETRGIWQDYEIARELKLDQEETYMDILREDRKNDLRRARRRTRTIPLSINSKMVEKYEAEQADKVAKRKIRSVEKNIKL